MKFDILTIFPEIFNALDESILKKAQEQELINIEVTNIRDYSLDKHCNVDDYPYGGGAGMVMKPGPIFRAVEAVQTDKAKVLFMSPQGKTFDQEMAKKLATKEHLIILCGRYEGIDERIRQELIDEEVSIGDYVLTGGEFPAMVLVDAIARMVPSVLGTKASAIEDSFYNGILDYPHYTRPSVFRSLEVPKVLLSGNHQKIAQWRKKKSLKRTLLRRPDLFKNVELTEGERSILNELKDELEIE
ncbi:tRNA (guanosine(37)-N1)-methyltransferase TrmD [Selenihalanaerobacter shriftii]|uniref:tRNA (guanosine(37)-N1)-methyltransferase TrmD n=1 Tax=Selenihalanaerobacter shriftii TaxID=142842 RepID=UPI0009993804